MSFFAIAESHIGLLRYLKCIAKPVMLTLTLVDDDIVNTQAILRNSASHTSTRASQLGFQKILVDGDEVRMRTLVIK